MTPIIFFFLFIPYFFKLTSLVLQVVPRSPNPVLPIQGFLSSFSGIACE
jgi:hypothetical protein